jgi:signal peptidase I
MTDGTLYRNGQTIEEPYVSHLSPDTDPTYTAFKWQLDYLVRSAHASPTYLPSRNNWGPLVVPADNYFVLGDNRDNSLDSRYWGFVPDSLIRGRPLFVYFSYVPDSTSHFSWLTHARWRRFGTIIR